MLSDTRVAPALDALEAPIKAFRSALANTSEQVRLLISTRLERNGSSVRGARAELGEFAAGRIDPERMSHLLTHAEPQGIEHGELVVRALDTCNELLARRESLFTVAVAEGEDLRGAVARGLAQIGRAFGAARLVDLVSQGSYRESEHGALLDAHPFEDWSRAERAVPLGLVVCVAGRDLRVGGLADFLDRNVKLVLVVEGESPPAALVRLVTPGVLVLQTAEVSELGWIAKFDGPSVAALVASSAAHFRHDPEGGARLCERLVITNLPEGKPRRLGVTSSFQQRQDLAQLEALAASAPAPAAEETRASVETSRAPGRTQSPAPTPAVPAVDPADKLSAWLLSQADLSGPP
jgi:hypothetical protein